LTKRVDYPLGNAFNPVSDEQLEGKFNALVVPALGEEGAGKIVTAGWKLDEAKSPDELMKLAKMPSGSTK
jgi:2-methylcitrate dehydratase PrpD